MSDSFLEPDDVESGRLEEEERADDVAEEEGAEALEEREEREDPGIRGPEAPGLTAPD